jgi:DnaJ-class molecular chaperone
MSAATTCPECHGRKEVRDWQTGKVTDCLECDGLGVVRHDWYETNGAQRDPDDGGRAKPAGGRR